jgi:hypothetical protein
MFITYMRFSPMLLWIYSTEASTPVRSPQLGKSQLPVVVSVAFVYPP